jgi:hypothetical protein
MPWISHESQTAFETTDDLSAQLRAAEERIRELEAKVRLLEDKADRAERWVYKIWVEILVTREPQVQAKSTGFIAYYRVSTDRHRGGLASALRPNVPP